MAIYYKPQSPIQSGEDFIYPLTTADQVILSDGSRLEKNGQISIGGGTVKTVSGVAPEIMLALYPVGSIYMSVSATSPASLFGGTWEQIKDLFLLGAGDTYNAGSTGGEAEHTLTIEETATHDHDVMTHDHGNSVNNEPLSPFFTQVEPDDYDIGVIIQTSHSTSAGGGQPHNNMPPYLAVYMWKRVS